MLGHMGGATSRIVEGPLARLAALGVGDGRSTPTTGLIPTAGWNGSHGPKPDSCAARRKAPTLYHPASAVSRGRALRGKLAATNFARAIRRTEKVETH